MSIRYSDICFDQLVKSFSGKAIASALSVAYNRGMRDQSLQSAITAVGGVGVLASALGISGAAISQWTRCPVHRVLAVEAVSGVHRTELRPDVYPPEDR